MLDTSYAKFCDMVTGYRMFSVINQAVQTGIIDLLDGRAIPADELVTSAGMRPEEGGRFLAVLVDWGILLQCDGKLALSDFARSWLASSSPTCQRRVLEFEPILMANWNKLGVVLKEGQSALVTEKTADEYSRRLDLFQRAMGEAAIVRAGELWQAISELAQYGTIIDIGAGDAVYLKQFLRRYPGWKALACDLPDVCQRHQDSVSPPGLTFYKCNILDEKEMSLLVARQQNSADVVLLSNVCHCYSDAENVHILQSAAKLLKPDAVLLVHDFFRDRSDFGAMYDLHLMVNTYNGRCFSTREIDSLLTRSGLKQNSIIELPSGSVVMAYGCSH